MKQFTFELPEIRDYLESDYEVASAMMSSLFYNYSIDAGATSQPHWLGKFSNQFQGNRMLIRLAELGMIITTVPKPNWSEIIINEETLLATYTQDELNELVRDAKLSKLGPKFERTSLTAGAMDTKLESGIQYTGIFRRGFAKCAQHRFTYSTTVMKKFRDQIVTVTNKSMRKMEAKLGYSLRNTKRTDYTSIIEEVIDSVVADPYAEYNLGKLTNDSRGRATFNCVRQIFNPISNKLARSLIVTPPTAVTADALRSAYLFIAELYTGFEPNITKKIASGKLAYKQRCYHKIDMTSNKALDSLFENIWLSRLYDDLDAYYLDNNHLVTTPLEVDFSASNMTIIGILLGHKQYIDPSTYMWKIDGLSKLHVKFAQTPYVFGSSASVQSLWRKNGLEYNDEQVSIMRRAQLTGKFSIANEFKDIIIKHCNPEPVMQLSVGSEKYIVECNRYKNVGDITTQYSVYDSVEDKIKNIRHTSTHKVPDLEQFRRYFVTGLIHNRDSWLENKICLDLGWMLPIHDAGIVTWAGATPMRQSAVKWMRVMRDDRKVIVESYLKSINLDNAGWKRYHKLITRVDAERGSSKLTISPYLLK